MRIALICLILALLAGCMARHTPIQDLQAYPVQAEAVIAFTRTEVASCLHDAARSGDVARMSIFAVPMPEVQIIERDDSRTDVVVQFFQDMGIGNAALYELQGSDPTSVALRWPWERGSGAREGVRATRDAPYRWLDDCSDSDRGVRQYF